MVLFIYFYVLLYNLYVLGIILPHNIFLSSKAYKIPCVIRFIFFNIRNSEINFHIHSYMVWAILIYVCLIHSIKFYVNKEMKITFIVQKFYINKLKQAMWDSFTPGGIKPFSSNIFNYLLFLPWGHNSELI